jgi:aspartokinase-like uncharacterized kinase
MMQRSELNVIKIGGAITAIPGALDRVCHAVAVAAAHHRIVVVPGGGPFADAVRLFEQSHTLSPDASHWMAILAMDQYALVLSERITGSVLVDEAGAVSEALGCGRLAVLAPSRWMRTADVLPHSWAVTSDSIAAFVAGALDATRLILIKPGTNLAQTVDSHFAASLHSGMSCSVLACDRMNELSDRLSGW